MANFNYDALRQKMAEELGYHLFLDYGTVEDYEDLQLRLLPYRDVNEIVTPVVGLFRLNPTPLTALKYPYIAITTATIDIPAPTEEVGEVRNALNGLAETYNGTAEKIRQGDTTYTVVYNFETPVVGDKRRDVSLYMGEIMPVTQVVTFTIVESGVSCYDVGLRIDGLDVPLLLFMETRTAASETAPNANAKGEATISQELYGITFETPAVENALGDLLREMVDEGNGNRVHAVEVTKSGVSKVYMMVVGTAGATVQPPNNVGYSFSLVEAAPNTGRFNANWREVEIEGAATTYVEWGFDGAIFWGDGTASPVKNYAVHSYTDGKTTHTAKIVRYGVDRWGAIAKDASLFGKRVRVLNNDPGDETLPIEIVRTDEYVTQVVGDSTAKVYDAINLVSGNVFEMVVGGVAIPVYASSLVGGTVTKYGVEEFVSLLRGRVTSVKSGYLSYDRWAVDEEV